jgi:hypothetical protein
MWELVLDMDNPRRAIPLDVSDRSFSKLEARDSGEEISYVYQYQSRSTHTLEGQY